MIKLYGFPISNYYNKVKLVLLEKGIPFTEEKAFPSRDEKFLKQSPLGKIPYIETEHGVLSESQAILEYLEETFPEIPLYPEDCFGRAKCRELIQHLELNVELHARRLYKEAIWGGSVSDETKMEVKDKLTVGLKGIARIAKFSNYIAGEKFTAADCVAWPHFLAVSVVSQKIYSTDLVSNYIPSVSSYLQHMESRPHVQKVEADRVNAKPPTWLIKSRRQG